MSLLVEGGKAPHELSIALQCIIYYSGTQTGQKGLKCLSQI